VNALQTVHVRVNDAATRQPTACRIRFTDAHGCYHAPLGRLPEFATERGLDVGGNVLLDGQAFAYIDGTCEIPLPPGPLSVSISKGPEYRPLQSEVVLAPGKLALRFELERWTDLRANRWYSGDTCCHFLTPHAALLEAAAEDVAVVNVLVREEHLGGEAGKSYRAIPNLLAFSGQVPALERPGHQVVVGTRNRHAVLGDLLLLNSHRVVYPLTFGGPEGVDNWTLAAWCDQCHRKAGLVIGESFFCRSPTNHRGELLADLLLEKIDALNFSGWHDPLALLEWCGLLDLGYHVPLTAGSRKQCNLQVLGSPRTYARLEPGQDFTYKNWIEAVRAGRTFVTSGPLLLLSVNERGPGAVIELSAEAPTVRIRVEAQSLCPLDCLQVMANHVVVARDRPTASTSPATLEAELALPDGGWLSARCEGPGGVALTSAIYVHVDGRRPPPHPIPVCLFAGYLENLLTWVHGAGRFENDAQREHLADLVRTAQNTLKERTSLTG
jgi:hypothetical protein